MSNWEYGNIMLEQGNIFSLDEWSDEKEYCCSVMDREFDYLWDFSKGIHFIDRLYSERPDIYDKTMDEAELWFDNFDEVRQFINSKRGDYMNYFISFIDDADFEWCVLETTDKEYAVRAFDDMSAPPGYRMELRATTEPVETYRTYEVLYKA